ncbi:MAG: hypothetical protein IJ842_01190 [Bacilli bacterium]|nr:hypothetical protein [Bacilli bacterium]
MNKLSFWDKIKVLFNMSFSSYFFPILIIIIIVLTYLFINNKKKYDRRNKMIYLFCSIFFIALIILCYQSSITDILENMMNNFFIVLYFPNFAVYTAAIIISNIILYISIFNYNLSDRIRKTNIIVSMFLNYILALVLKVITNNNINVYETKDLYKNNNIRALINISAIVFILWICFLLIYKFILVYLNKDHKVKVKRVIIKQKVLPENYVNVKAPSKVLGNNIKKDIPKDILVKDTLTLEDYKVLLEILKERKKKIKKKNKLLKIIDDEYLKEQNKISELDALYRSIR